MQRHHTALLPAFGVSFKYLSLQIFAYEEFVEYVICTDVITNSIILEGILEMTCLIAISKICQHFCFKLCCSILLHILNVILPLMFIGNMGDN